MKIEVKKIDTKRNGKPITLLRWRDLTGKVREKRYKGKRYDSHKEKARQDLEQQLNRVGNDEMWSSFCETLSDYFEGMSPRSIEKSQQTLRKFSNLFGDFECSELSKDHMRLFKESLKQANLAAATVDSTLATMWAILRWGSDEDLLPVINRPRKRSRKIDRGKKSKSKGRSLATEEIERLLMCIPQACKPGEDPASFTRAAMAAWLIGLRLDDCHMLSFKPRLGCHWISGDLEHIHFAESQKSGQVETVPLEKPATEWLATLDQSLEWVCRARGDKGWHATSNRLGRVLSAAGKKAGIVVKRDAAGACIKTASHHDLRRTFATTLLASGMAIKDVQLRTRHSDHNTLLSYYADIERRSGGYPVVAKSSNSTDLASGFAVKSR